MTIRAAVSDILRPERPALLAIDPMIERRMERARREAWARPVWVCHRFLGIGAVCGQTFWGERPRSCPRCGQVFHE